jgi:hypothetical protein
MDGCPERFAPRNLWINQEPFPQWWSRIGKTAFPTVPEDVARQFLWEHWGLSEWHKLPSATAKFELRPIHIEDVIRAVGWRYSSAEMLAHGHNLLQRKSQVPLAAIMFNQGKWPTPPILIDRTRPVPGEPPDLPTGRILVEGHTRMAIAKALAADGLLKPDLDAWFIQY